MICTYLRASSINQHKLCEMRYLFEYVLNKKSPTGKKACLGSMFHKVMEVRSLAQIANLKGEISYEDDQFGTLSIDEARDIDKITDLSFNHYVQLEPHLQFDEADRKTVKKWIHGTLEKYSEYDPFNLNVIAAELYFDIEIDKPWAKYSTVIQDEKIEGNLRIKGTMDTVLDLGSNMYEMFDYKGLPVETLIPTPTGFKTMGSLSVGDIVFDQYGKKCLVTNKSNQIFKPCYKLTFDDTSTVICDNEHYWKLDDESVVQVENLKIGNKINVAKPIDCEDIELPIDPYVLGVWLGDGRRRCAEISSADPFVFQEIRRRGFKIGKNIASDKSKICKQKTITGLTGLLRKNNLLYNKHIPEIYLRASYTQRLDLLRGLMDSDGSVNTVRKQCVFTNCNEKLSRNTAELLLTLGQRPLVSKVKTVCKKQNYTGVAYPVSFKPIDINPFLLDKKAKKVDKNWGYGKSNKRKIVSIEKIETKLTQCITVNSPDSTYLCTEKFIPTHNTGQYRTDFATGKVKDLEYLKKDVQLLLYLLALKHIYPDKEFVMTLFYVNAGGIFSVVADDEMYDAAWTMLEKEFKTITKNYNPTQLDATHRDFRCKYLCPLSKPSAENPRISICNQMKNEISKNGFTKTVASKIDLSVFGKYGTGGGRTNVENG